jgi:hypothetical protein
MSLGFVRSDVNRLAKVGGDKKMLGLNNSFIKFERKLAIEWLMALPSVVFLHILFPTYPCQRRQFNLYREYLFIFCHQLSAMGIKLLGLKKLFKKRFLLCDPTFLELEQSTPSNRL